MTPKLFLALAAFTLSGCVTAAATNFTVPKERVTECKTICTDIGMELSSVVIIRSSAGCVCQMPGATQAQQSAAAVAGGAVIVEEEEAATQQRHHASQPTATSGRIH